MEWRAAMQVLKSQFVDFLVTDIQMPGMDGMALLMQVGQDPELARLLLILISGPVSRNWCRPS